MNDALSATWILFFAVSVLIQLVVPRKYSTKLPNNYAAIVSSLLLANSVPIGYFAFGAKTGTVFATASVYLVVNAWVLSQWRFHTLRTRKQTTETVRIVILLLGLYLSFEALGLVTLTVASGASLLVSCMILGLVWFQLRKSKVRFGGQASGTTPKSVSLAVPARNETHALTKHLKSVVQTDYEKLEILVADDCSQDDTAQIIRSFAHDGVRFVQGHTPTDSWIGKNRAYQLLSAEASGEYIFFSGVDTRYEPDTVSKLIAHMEHNKLDMVSIMPQHKIVELLSPVLQPMRYLLMLVGSTKQNPPVLSTTWIIKRKKLEKYGGFEAVENSIVPEQYFARKARADNAYEFIVAPKELGLTTYKKPASQRDTAIRYVYPRLRRTVGYHLVFSVAFGLVVGLPIASLWAAAFGAWDTASLVSLISLVLLCISYALILVASYPVRVALFAPLYIVAGAFHMYAISIVSMISYELDAVVWKGRNVCYPVMLDRLHKKS